MARGRRAVEVVLSDVERETLERWARRRKSSQALALRCRIVLGAAAGETNKSIAARLGCVEATVSKWRNRFAERRLDGLADDPRPGPPRTIGDEKVEEVLVKTLEEAPEGATHWSVRSMAAEAGISPWSVHRIWRAFGLKPHLVEEFKVSPDPQFIDKVRDVVGLYLNPPEAAVVLCVDEKTGVQAIDRTAPILPLLPGTPQRRSHDYRRHGTTDLFAALDAASGKVITAMTARHRSEEFRKFLNLIDKEVPQGLDVHIVLDNVSAHKTPGHPALAHPPPPLQVPLHPHLLELDEPRRALVLRAHHQMAAPRDPHQRRRPQGVHQRLDRQLEPQPPPVRMAQERRRHIRDHGLISTTNSPNRTLEPRGLDINAFYSNHQQLMPAVVQVIDQALSSSDLNVEMLVTGTNGDSHAIYSIMNPGIVHDHSAIGHGAIGSGAPHALYSLIETEFRSSMSKDEVVDLVKKAKTRSEVAPGVGHHTTVVTIPSEDNHAYSD